MLDLSIYNGAAQTTTGGHGVEVRLDGSFAIMLMFYNTGDFDATLRLLLDAPMLLDELKAARAAIERLKA